MARNGLSALVRAGMACGAFCGLLCLLNGVQGGPPQEREGVAAALEVQKALQLGKDLMLKGSYEAAVHVLEEQITRINGSREYLAILREAYRGYVKELRLANKDQEAEVFQRRLQILDPGAALDKAVARAPSQPVPKQPAAQTKAQAAEPPKPATVRGVMGSETKSNDPFQAANARQARAWLEEAEQEYASQHYEQASRLYEQVHRTNQQLTAACRDRWGYSKLYTVVQRLNRSETVAYADLEREVRQAIALAPAKLEGCGKDLLQRIQERSNGSARGDDAAESIAVRNLDRAAGGWAVAESANFRVYHNQPREMAEKAARVAERTRTEMLRKWFNEPNDAWPQKCDLYLHATAEDYAQASHAPLSSPGHSRIQTDGGRVLSREMHMHCDNQNMLIAVLPHETTHVVIAGKFGDRPVPRWADEGIAVLTEPREQVERHLRNLPKHSQERQLFYLRDLVQLDDYPQQPQRVGAFYAQSVSLVDFLSRQKGPQTFAQFVHDGQCGSYEEALRRHYGYQGFPELEQRWRAYAFRETAASTNVAGRDR
jgi:tetratricopeptide (TPR) repeat protein